MICINPQLSSDIYLGPTTDVLRLISHTPWKSELPTWEGKNYTVSSSVIGDKCRSEIYLLGHLRSQKMQHKLFFLCCLCVSSINSHIHLQHNPILRLNRRYM